jgi:hypothetical protein
MSNVHASEMNQLGIRYSSASDGDRTNCPSFGPAEFPADPAWKIDARLARGVILRAPPNRYFVPCQNAYDWNKDGRSMKRFRQVLEPLEKGIELSQATGSSDWTFC